MKTIRTITILILSILLWIVLLNPRVVTYILGIAEGIIRIIKETFIYFIKQIESEVYNSKLYKNEHKEIDENKAQT